jgi:hypothetical protein
MSAIIVQRKPILRPRYSAPSGAVPFFSNNFASGDFSYNDGGNRWSNHTAAVSINNTFGYGGSGFCAEFDVNSDAELRFEFALKYAELWIVWIAWYPSGFEVPSIGPRYESFDTVIPPSKNNKFLRLIGGTSAAEQTPRRGIETFLGSPSGDEEINIEASLASDPTPGAIGDIPKSFNNGKNFPTDPNRGFFMPQKFYAKKSTNTSTADGQESFWVNEELWQVAVPFAEQQTDVGFGNGYFGGSINRPMPVGTVWYLGEANFYATDPG